jgi:hypothetical protein
MRRRALLLGLAGAGLRATAAEPRVTVEGEDLVLRDAEGRELRRAPGRDLAGKRHGPPQALLHHAGRRSVVAAFPAFDELWELPLERDAPPVFDGLVHDWRMGEAIATPGWFTPRRMPLAAPMPVRWWLDPAWPWVGGAFDDAVIVVHLDVRRMVARLPLAGARLTDSSRDRWQGQEAWRLPHAAGTAWIDPRRWVLLQSG